MKKLLYFIDTMAAFVLAFGIIFVLLALWTIGTPLGLLFLQIGLTLIVFGLLAHYALPEEIYKGKYSSSEHIDEMEDILGAEGTVKLNYEREGKYLAEYGLHCPYCGSSRINSGELQPDGPVGHCDCFCEDCNETWTDIWKLTDVELDDVTDSPAPDQTGSDKYFKRS